MKRMTTLVASATLAISLGAAGTAAAAEEPTPKQIASQQCVAEKKADKAAFKATYGKNAMRNCKRALSGEAGETLRNAAQECKAERDADAALFAETYGTNANGKNAFGKCVSSKSSDEVEEEVEEFDSAAQECRAERAADAEAFAETYGTNRNKRNAFGKCVSQKSQEDEEEPVEEPVV